jgi:hypothetical protein
MDETTFFYKFMPRCSYVLNAAPALKQDKSRVTVVACTNANGAEKLPLLFVGKSANPRWISRKPHGVNVRGRCTTTVPQTRLTRLARTRKRSPDLEGGGGAT